MSKQYIFVDSADKLAGTASEFVVQCTSTIYNIKTLYLESACIPYSWYDSNSNISLVFQEQAGGGVVTVPVPPAYYTPATLATEIQTLLNAHSPNSLTYTVTQSNGKYTVSSTGNFKLLWTTAYNANHYNYLYYFMGFNALNVYSEPDPDTGYATSHTSSGVGSISTNDYVWVRINPLPNNIVTTSSSVITAVLPVSGNWMDKLFFYANGNYEQKIDFKTNGTNLQSFSIQITGQDNQPLDFNGVTASFVFSYTTYDY